MLTQLTTQKLKDMQPGEVFAKGFEKNEPEGLFMTDHDQGRWLKWIACRGLGFHDWAIYCYWEEESDEYIKDYGDKISLQNAMKLIDCDKEAKELYRN